MTLRTSKVLAMAAAAALCAAGIAKAADPTPQELLQQVKDLQAKVQAMEARQASAPDAATIATLLQDAHNRSQLLADSPDGSAGYDDNGFYIRMGPDFSIRPRIYLQIRNASTWAQDKKNDGSDFENGFELRRARLVFTGNAFSPDFTYMFESDVNRSNGTFGLLEAWGQYRFNPDFAVRAGQMKDPVFRENLVSSSAQLFADLSFVDGVVGSGLGQYVQGVMTEYGSAESPFHAKLMLQDGIGSVNTSWTDHFPVATPPAVTPDTNFGVSGRVEYKVMGNWKDYADFTARTTKEDLLVFGAGADVTQRDNSNLYLMTADAQYKNGKGLSVFAAFDGDYYDYRGASSGTRFDWGAIVQAGYMLNPSWEALARFGYVQLDNDFVTGQNTFEEIGVGLNWYLGQGGKWGHRAKMTFDAIYLPNGAPADVTGVDVVGDPGNNEFILRVQLQLVL